MFGIPVLFAALQAMPIIGGILRFFGAVFDAILGCKPCLIAIVAVSVLLFTYYQGWKSRDRDYQVIRAEVSALEKKFNCPSRPRAERELSACIAARELEAVAAKTAELERQKEAAARAQQDLDNANLQIAADAQQLEQIILLHEKMDDGTVPKVLLEYWAKRREQMGVK